MTKMNTFLFLDINNKYFNKCLLDHCMNRFNILNIFDQSNLYSPEKYDDRIHFSLSFLNPYIIKDQNIIHKKYINIHPSTPKYRGVCGASMALYYKDLQFGATAHYIDEKIDNGPIITVKYFDIVDRIDCYSLGMEAKHASMILAMDILLQIFHTKKLPIESTIDTWGYVMMKRNLFNKWMTVELNDNQELNDKIRACYNNAHPGPYIRINNITYELKMIQQ